MLPTIKSNLILTGLRAVEKAEQTRDEAVRADSSPPRGKERSPEAGVTYSANANGSKITLTAPGHQGLGSLLDCCV
ncbi:MAG: hypothetical protein JNN07_04240 [Verrucomicrobiales bacterium]|nr:hypothetical protein [Verrucomicrobiales bacterium]